MAARRNILSIVWLMSAAALLAAPAFAQQEGPITPPPVPDAQTAPATKDTEAGLAQKRDVAKIVVPAGTRLPLVLRNTVTTRSNQPGDPVYLQTTFPVVVDDQIVIPVGTYVSGEIIEIKRPGRVKGRGEMRLRLLTMIFPNGYSANFNAIPTGAGDNETVEKEGKIKGDSNKSGDAGTIIRDTAAGAGIGAIASQSGKGAGIGAGIGGAVGLASVLLTRGPELVLRPGTSIDIMLDRPLYLDTDRVQFNGPGRYIQAPRPLTRRPARSTTDP